MNIVIRSQMDIVACLLASWSSVKDPDRYSKCLEPTAKGCSGGYSDSVFVVLLS
jgi:hypothetical protein